MITYETLKSFCGHDLYRPQMQYACRREDGWWATDSYRVIYVPMEECQQGDVRFLCDEMPKDAGRYPDVENAVNVKGFMPRLLIPVKAIEDALAQLPLTDEMMEGKCEMKFIQCPQCGGEGEIEISQSFYFNDNWYNAEATVECPICHGHGQIPDVEDYDPDDCEWSPDSPEYYTMVKTGKKVPDVNNTLLHIPGNCFFKAAFALDLLRVAREQGVDKIEYNRPGDHGILLFRLHGVIVGFVSAFNDDGKEKYIDIKI